ncbi:molybdopterin molybdotransferase MoeA [Candidatus Uabimicrobium sp. HlEnr_7]|uniref:molybdopterin molybdotransferase MoeA n=1 Tax=Candidatus Uabimicrobium helgolandensis TaxID=3095367 RepID=UPI003558C680
MITVEEASSIILNHAEGFSRELCKFNESYGKILAEDIIADRDLPPFHRVAMDGIAICLSSWLSGQKSFAICGVQSAGAPCVSLEKEDECWEIMTGAVLPVGCDCVIPVEYIKVEDGVAHVVKEIALEPMTNIHQKASDYKKGTKLIDQGQKIDAHHISVIASVGKANVLVYKIPKIAIIATGDELVAVDSPITDYQIRISNTYAVECGLHKHGFTDTEIFHLKDNKSELQKKLQLVINEADIVILSGGVSKGKYDYVPEVLTSLGVELLFRRVQQRPGKPFTFGVHCPSNKPVFAIPGNPVTATTCFRHYVLPYLYKASALTLSSSFVTLKNNFNFRKSLTYFLPVKIENDKGVLLAVPSPTAGSGDYASLIGTDGYVELDSAVDHFEQGVTLSFYPW